MLMEAGRDPRAQPQGIHHPIPDFAEAPVALKTGVHHQGNQIPRISHWKERQIEKLKDSISSFLRGDHAVDHTQHWLSRESQLGRWGQSMGPGKVWLGGEGSVPPSPALQRIPAWL